MNYQVTDSRGSNHVQFSIDDSLGDAPEVALTTAHAIACDRERSGEFRSAHGTVWALDPDSTGPVYVGQV